MERRLQSSGSTVTEELGAELARGLAAGDAVLIVGEMGTGKTTLVRGACRALGVRANVTSPTFTIGQRYAGPVPVSHLDLFRIGELADEDPDLFDDYVGPGTISFVELAPDRRGRLSEVEEAIGELARVAHRVGIEHAGGDQRIVTIT